eukprot:38269-Chlamydomonas_euryale.AAC.1
MPYRPWLCRSACAMAPVHTPSPHTFCPAHPRLISSHLLPRAPQARLQRHPDHGNPGARVLRLVWLPRDQLLFGLVPLWHAGRAQGPYRRGAPPRPRRAHGHCALARVEERRGRHQHV